MYDFQNTVLLAAKPRLGTMIFRYLSLGFVALGLLGCVWINPFTFALPTLLLIIWWWWMSFHTNIEYEYTYFDGNLDFDLIKDKRKRKNIISFHMEQVERIAPVGDASLQELYKHASNVRFKDLSSRKEGRKCYELLQKEGTEVMCIRFEPSEKFLDDICIKYSRKVTK